MTSARMTSATSRTLGVAVALFMLAGLTGVLFRMAAAYGWSLGLDPVNIRHAHSHLMIFGWVIPAIFALVGAIVVRGGGNPPSGRLFTPVLAAAVAAWGSFLLWGYEPTRIGSARMPVSVIVSTLAMVLWYVFAAWYRRARVNLEAGSLRTLIDIAVVLLVVSTFGAWGVAGAVAADGSPPALKIALTHLFLALFTEGWVVAALLGLAWARLPSRVALPRWAVNLFLAGVAVSFLLGMPGSLVDGNLRLVARLGGMAWGIGAVGLVWSWWRGAPRTLRASWGPPMLLLAIKGSAQAAFMLVPGLWWADMAPMRVLYLHVLLLGFATSAIAAGMVRGRGLAVFQAASILVVLSLVPMTDLWPAALALGQPMEVAAWAAVVLPLSAVLLFRRSYTEL